MLVSCCEMRHIQNEVRLTEYAQSVNILHKCFTYLWFNQLLEVLYSIFSRLLVMVHKSFKFTWSLGLHLHQGHLNRWNQCPELWNWPTCPLVCLTHYSDYLKKKKKDSQNRNSQLLAYKKEIFCFWEFATSSQAGKNRDHINRFIHA